MRSSCCHGSKWQYSKYPTHTFDEIDISIFRKVSFKLVIGYIWYYIDLLITICFYASDIYTTVLLLRFDKWTFKDTTIIGFNIIKWLFSGCIIFSFVLLGLEMLIAFRIIRSRSIARAYTDSWARRYYVFKGYDYYCFLARITKSRHFIDYITLFVSFSFKNWFRMTFADGPRQVINAITLFKVLKLESDFITTIREIAISTPYLATIICLMAFSFAIWAITVIRFCIALILYFPLIIHTGGSLNEFCYAKIAKRVANIVAHNSLKPEDMESIANAVRLNTFTSEDSDTQDLLPLKVPFPYPSQSDPIPSFRSPKRKLPKKSLKTNLKHISPDDPSTPLTAGYQNDPRIFSNTSLASSNDSFSLDYPPRPGYNRNVSNPSLMTTESDSSTKFANSSVNSFDAFSSEYNDKPYTSSSNGSSAYFYNINNESSHNGQANYSTSTLSTLGGARMYPEDRNPNTREAHNRRILTDNSRLYFGPYNDSSSSKK